MSEQRPSYVASEKSSNAFCRFVDDGIDKFTISKMNTIIHQALDVKLPKRLSGFQMKISAI
jgi:hypothetical protein